MKDSKNIENLSGVQTSPSSWGQAHELESAQGGVGRVRRSCPVDSVGHHGKVSSSLAPFGCGLMGVSGCGKVGFRNNPPHSRCTSRDLRVLFELFEGYRAGVINKGTCPCVTALEPGSNVPKAQGTFATPDSPHVPLRIDFLFRYSQRAPTAFPLRWPGS